nr:capsid protein [Cressdnaviricota sp.]UOF82589.1 capsid protein [Cressdnaviricota sp.]
MVRYPFRSQRKVAKRYAKKLISRGKKRYFKGKGYGNPRLMNIARDVSTLKSIINSEKKNYIITSSSLTGAQCYGASGSGHYVVDITPIPAQGNTDITRNGDSIKVCSAFIKFQIYEQANSTHPMKGKIIIMQVLGTPQTASTFMTNIIKPNPMLSNSIYDYNSSYNPDFRGQYKHIVTRYFGYNDNYSSSLAIKDVTIKLKLNHHVRFTANTTTVADGQYVMIVLFDSGNSHASEITTTTGAPVTGALTGAVFHYNATFYYYDN